ncbi:MAG: hypothetical protein LYZ69_06110 [Nitrososphaerales archaeon]|nr:hypothetical protein [Nitrososphaerales archaeon]
MVIPTRAGKDLENADRTRDAHIRIESYRHVGTNVYVDVFDSATEDADDAHIVSEAFPWADEGADQATRFLQKFGFRTVVMIK